MEKNRFIVLPLFFLALLADILGAGFTAAQAAEAPQKKPSAYQFEHPAWFKISFLDLQEEIREAAQQDKRLLLYIGQDGCPYCRALIQDNFGQKSIADYTRKHFDVVAINLWGDVEVTDFSGQQTTEKQFAAALDIKYTPTLLFFDEQAKLVLRLNGYLPPQQFQTALAYVAGKHEKTLSFRDHYAKNAPVSARGKLNHKPYFLSPPYQLNARRSGKPLLVLFEQKVCPDCDSLHKNILALPETQALMKRFDVLQLDLWGDTPVLTPDGRQQYAGQWAKTLGLIYAPSAVLFSPTGEEIMRVEAMLKRFHFQSILDYVASSAYRTQPNFQLYLDERATRLRAQGAVVDIWN